VSSDAKTANTYCVDAVKIGGVGKSKVTHPSVVDNILSSVLSINVPPLLE
jgi:hypothetical protein